VSDLVLHCKFQNSSSAVIQAPDH